MRRSPPSLSLAAALTAALAGPGCFSSAPDEVINLESEAFASVSMSSDPAPQQEAPRPEPPADAAPPPPADKAKSAARTADPQPRAAGAADVASLHSALSNVRGVQAPGSSSGLMASKLDMGGSGAVGMAFSGSAVARRGQGGMEPDIDGERERRGPRPKKEISAYDMAEEPSAQPSAGGTFVHAGTNPFVLTREDALSTFAIDVDTASYTYARRFLERGRQPPAASVRVEEWVNAFHYSYPQPKGPHPFAIDLEAAPSPLSDGKLLLRVGIQGKKIENAKRDPVHLTFLVDTSGSMRAHDKLPLAKSSLHLLVDQLRSDDSVALITYAGSTREVLSQTWVNKANKAHIHRAIDALAAGGGTAMSSGMELAYQNANKHLGSGSTSRVIVLSDGDANIGKTSHQAILQSIKGYASEGITLSTVGLGTGNYRDHLMEQLADAGNGNYSYIDSEKAARKVFVEDLTGTLQVIAQDVKIQVEMNPEVVRAYRLLGYENRDVADRDFRNDKVDAGEIGAGHSVTALYEVELVGQSVTGDLGTVRVRYKKPRGTKATEVAETFTAGHAKDRFGDLDRDTRFAAALSVAAEVLRGSPFAEDLTLEDAWALAAEAADGPYATERRELVQLLDRTVRSSSVASR